MRQLAVAGAIAIGASAPAHASGVGIVAISGPGIDRSGVVRAMSVAIGSDAVVEDAVGDARVALAAGAVPISTLEQFRRVHDAIDEGWRAFLRVQVDLAASRLAVARTDAAALVVYPGGAVLYADASLRLGAVLGHVGRTDEAHAAIAVALALDPERSVTIAEFSPDVVALVDTVRAEARPSHPVRITTVPAAAMLAIDGKDAGHAPLGIDLASGQHVIVATSPGREPHAQAIAVDGAAQDVSFELSPDRAALALAEGPTLGLPAATARDLAEATLRFADLDSIELVAAVVRRGGPTLLVQRCAGLPVQCSAVVEIGYADASGVGAAAREAWRATRTADLRYAPTVLTDAGAAPSREDGRCKLCRSPILWGSVGAAAVISTIVVIALVSGSRPPPTVGVDPTQF